ncbi:MULTISPECIES: glycosyltransferase [Gammaproteobacteria]|uniref:glycosyltransferase n=1 Tax=Gammaproteobacteria TaxID=1236 RepID=UPI001914120E|nr:MULTISPECIES: glycosyltransferase [Gammaproteobacteria]MBK5310663.1 glycosyltransferase [Pseudomonas sp. TH71]MBK5369867.1 glycosyltransferase [Pseudomonas sp. TH40]MBK5381036.1 glycosyltransferase [Pseudomonas sp. TH35]MBK5386495.1 glycosyltransferase [Pseudomonas sp. TH38]MBK5403790.1 glycosyltransferase [Pseudomonas sp. TH37]
MVKIAVLLAAYNGVKWLPAQVESILQQKNVDVNIFISVDSSSDATEAWVSELALNNTQVKVLPHGEHFGGAGRNFYRLIRDVDFSEFDYIALADQDDIWLADKLSAAHERILESCASGYSSNVTAFWSDGRKVLLDKAQHQRKYDFLFEAAGPGCSYVLKVSDALEFKRFVIANWSRVCEVSLHDWLVYAWFRSSGLSWYIDPVSHMLYRQHSNNQFGANTGIKALVARLSLLRSGWYRGEVSKISGLLADKAQGLPASLLKQGKIPSSFLIRNWASLRRRFRDRVFLLVMVVLGIY